MPIGWSVQGAFSGKSRSMVLTGAPDSHTELHVSRLALPACGVVARVVDVGTGNELVRLGTQHAGHYVDIGSSQHVALHVEPDGSDDDVLARCGALPNELAAGIDVFIDSARRFVPPTVSDAVVSAAWVLPVDLGDVSPWLWHVSEPGAEQIEIVAESSAPWCGGLLTVTNGLGEAVGVGQLGSTNLVVAAAGDWFAVRLESKCATEPPPVVVTANATSRVFDLTEPQLVDGALEVLSDGAPWLSVHGGVPLLNANDFGPFERMELLPELGGQLSIAVPPWTPLSCAPDATVAQLLSEEVCKPGASLIVSPRPFFIRYRSGNNVLVRRVDAGLLVNHAASARPESPAALGDTNLCDAPKTEQACMRLDDLHFAPRLGCRTVDATGRDSDLDLLSDFAERCLTHSDPGESGDYSATGGRDTDQDGFSDGWEGCGVADLGWNLNERRPTLAGGPLCRDLLYETLYDLTNLLIFAGPAGPRGYPAVLDVYPENTFEHLRRGVEPLFFNWLGLRAIRPTEDLDDPRLAGSMRDPIVQDWAYVPADGERSCRLEAPVCMWVASRFNDDDQEQFDPRAPCPDQEAAHAAVMDPRCDGVVARSTAPLLVRRNAPVVTRDDDGTCTCTITGRLTRCDPATPSGAATIRHVDAGCDASVCAGVAATSDTAECSALGTGEFVDLFGRNRSRSGTVLPVYGTIIAELLPGVAGRRAPRASQTYKNRGRPFVFHAVEARDRAGVGSVGGQYLDVAAHELGHVLGLGHGPFHPDATHPAPLYGDEHPLYDSVMNYMRARVASARNANIRFSAGQRAPFDDLNVSSERLLLPGTPAAAGYVSTFVREDNRPARPENESVCSEANRCPAGYACVTNNHRATATQFFNPRDPYVCTNGALCEPDGAPCADGSPCRSTERSTFFTPGQCVPASASADLNGDGVVSSVWEWVDTALPSTPQYTQGWSMGLSCEWNPFDSRWILMAYGQCTETPSEHRTPVGPVRWEFCRAAVDPGSRPTCNVDSECAAGHHCDRHPGADGIAEGLCRPDLPERVRGLTEIEAAFSYATESFDDRFDTFEFTDALGFEHCVWMRRADRWHFAEIELDMNDFERMQFARIPFDLCGIDACEPGLSHTSNLFRDFDYWPFASPGLHEYLAADE